MDKKAKLTSESFDCKLPFRSFFAVKSMNPVIAVKIRFPWASKYTSPSGWMSMYLYLHANSAIHRSSLFGSKGDTKYRMVEPISFQPKRAQPNWNKYSVPRPPAALDTKDAFSPSYWRYLSLFM